MTDELLLLPQQGVPGCGVRMHGLYLWSSKGSGFGFAAGLAVSCFTDVSKPMDSLSSPCRNKMLLEDNCQVHCSYWKVGRPCEVRGMKGLWGGKKSLAALTITAEGLMSPGANQQQVRLVPHDACFCHLIPGLICRQGTANLLHCQLCSASKMSCTGCIS